jgi:tRNA nucleotidyltransferase (CCA-adding enzyme)
MDWLSIVPTDVRDVAARLAESGHRSWIVGGCVRDAILGRPIGDWDLATSARPEEVLKLFRKAIPTGIEHGTVTVVTRGRHVEVTTLRGEATYSDGRRPDAVHFVDDIAADLARRDFTINAIAVDTTTGALVDPFGGQRDLAARVLRAVGTAEERFAEDGLRCLRAARFVATLEVDLDPATERGIGSALGTYAKVSAERVRDEWMKTMKARRPSRAFEVMRASGMLGVTCPELLESVGCTQNRHHAYDVWGHAMACLDAAPAAPVLRVAALLHDVGKPRSRAFSEKTSDYTFYDHERIGAEIADPILRRLRFSNDERTRVVALVRHHLVCWEPSWSDAALRRWVRRVSPELLEDLYALCLADADGKGKDPRPEHERIAGLRAHVERLMAESHAFRTKDLAVSGHDLMRVFGRAPGPWLGRLLEGLLERVLDDPSLNTPERLLEAARAIDEDTSAQATRAGAPGGERGEGGEGGAKGRGTAG